MIASVTEETPRIGLLGYRRSLGPDGNAMMEQVTTLELRQSAWQKEIARRRRKLLIGAPTPPNEADYVRTALMRGLEIESETGENPYRFGFVGAIDGHIGMSSVEEDNFHGKIATD